MRVIEVDHVTKEFRLGYMHSLKQQLGQVWGRLTGNPLVSRARFTALDDVHFAVEQGEVVGLIGTNGAGKSTLLKILARVTSPTSGAVKISGSVAPMIEVGAGIVPELTGRENIRLNCTILGMSKKTIARKFDEIVAFSELEDFLDTPVKRYSSGMRVRLGFSIATSVDADILIVDEVLAVGDLAFQRKCFDRLENLINGCGSTVLLVSHNIRQVERMCGRVILLDHGKILADGDSAQVCSLFYERSNKKIYQDAVRLHERGSRIEVSGEVELLGVEIIDVQGNATNEIEARDTLRVRIRFNLRERMERPELVVGTHTTDFVYLSAGSTSTLERQLNYEVGEHLVEYIVPSFPMVPGIYCVRFTMFDQYRRPVFSGETLKIFSVKPRSDEVREAPYRTLDLPAEWIIDGNGHSLSEVSSIALPAR